ncbi:ankyrin-1-like [Nasonia vitripennis]|uniref:Ankyrin repeat protein n=1 Tax=Nasonia vitripennis TaxID=7425 RepID=A0A7M7H3N3_NASVI|nr:ankyrin-1-like [Nasonia vitripennis]XP_008202816.1 ankyrin-1-like [Nasonia vitripennis]
MATKEKKLSLATKSYDQKLYDTLLKIFRDNGFKSKQKKKFLRSPKVNQYPEIKLLREEISCKLIYPREQYDNLSLLQIAVIGRYPLSAELLLRSGADINKPLMRNQTLFEIMFCFFYSPLSERLIRLAYELGVVDLRTRYHNGRTVLHHAVINNRVELTKMILEKGVDPNIRDHLGITPLLLSLRGIVEDEEMLRLLVERGADVHSKDSRGSNALHRVFFRGKAEKCAIRQARFLIENGASLEEIQLENEYQPLHVVVSLGENNNELVKLFLAHGANVNAQAQSGESPLYIAAQFSSTEMLKTLLEHGADVNMRNDEGWTALHRACSKCYRESVRLLLSAGADMLIEDEHGLTAFARIPRDKLNVINSAPMIKALALKRVSLQRSVQLMDELILMQKHWLWSLYEKCVDLVLKMSFSTFVENLTFLDLLVKSRREIVRYMRNRRFNVDNFKLCKLRRFRVYAKDVRRAFENALSIYRCMLELEEVIDEVVDYTFPELVVRKIVDYAIDDRIYYQL